MAEQSTGDALNQIVDKIGAGLAEVSAAIADKAPEAWALVVQGGYAQAVAQIIIGGGYFTLAIVAMTAAWRSHKGTDYSAYDPPASLFFTILAGGLGIVFGIAAGSHLLDTHAVTMLIAPEATTARDLLMRAL